jgi:excisionase family DNA binding protein
MCEGVDQALRTAVREAVHAEIAPFAAELSALIAARNGRAPERRGLLHVKQAAALLNLHPDTLYKRARDLDVPSVKVGSRILFDPADLDAYARAHRRSGEDVGRALVVARA